MRIHLILLLLIIVASCSAQPMDEVPGDAYNQKSPELLGEFFKNWNKEIPPINDTNLAKLNDTIRQTYHVFTSFYKPLSIDSLGGSEWGDSIYTRVKYLIVQNSVKIYFTDKVYYSTQDSDDYIVKNINESTKDSSLRNRYLQRTDGKLSRMVWENYGPVSKDALVDSIMDFRPVIHCNDKRPLYLTSKYKDILNKFLGDEHYQLGTGGMMTPASSRSESEKKQKFLEKYIKIFYGHWGGYWQLNSYPVAYSITFDSQMKYAKIDFRMIYQGGEATLKNVDGNWVLLSSKLTWIE